MNEFDRKTLKQVTKTLNDASTYLKDTNVDIEHVRLMVEDAVGDIYAFMSDKSAPPKRQPLSDQAIWTANTEQIFEEGVRWAEQQHEIGGEL